MKQPPSVDNGYHKTLPVEILETSLTLDFANARKGLAWGSLLAYFVAPPSHYNFCLSDWYDFRILNSGREQIVSADLINQFQIWALYGGKGT